MKVGQRKDDVSVSVFSTKLNQVRKRWLEGKPHFLSEFPNLQGRQAGGLIISFSSESFFNLFDLLCFLKSSVWGMGDDLLAQHSDIHSVHMLFNLIVLTSTPLILMG